MVIEGIEIYRVRVPLAFVWKTSYGDQHDTDTVLVRMESQGHHAWGESCPPYIPNYSAEHTLATFHTVREHMAGRIIGQDIRTAQDLLGRLDFVKGNQFARAALEITWWVLEAKRQGVPLHVALGGTGDRVAVGADFGVQDSLDTLMKKIDEAIVQGFPRIKLKFRPGWDLDMVAAVRSTFPSFTFHIDCNAAYTLADVDLFRTLDRYRLAMIEQPLADDGLSLVNHAELATLPNFTYAGDIFPSSYFYRDDLGKPEIVLSGRGEIATSRVPGIAQEPDPDLLKRWTVDHASFRA